MRDRGAAVFMSVLRFHLRVGVRLALRAAAPLIAFPIVALAIQQDPAAALDGLARWLFAPPGEAGGGLAVGAIAIAMASWAAPRVTPGMTGWLRHLPITDVGQRLGALAALLAAQAPLGVALLLLGLSAACRTGHVSPVRPAAQLITMGAAAVAAWPGAHRWRSRLLALLAILAAAPGEMIATLIAVPLLAAAVRVTGRLSLPPPAALSRRRLSAAIPVPALIGIRALGGTLIVAPLVSLIPIAIMAALRVNNSDLPPTIAAGAARLGGGLATTMLVGTLVERLAVHRPPWCWARSLPLGAARRVDEDAVLLGVPCLVPLAFVAWMDPLAALMVAMCVPTLAWRGAGAVRHGVGTRAGPATPLLVEGALVAGLVALLPWLAVVALAAAPLARRAAAERDRQQPVSRWEDRHHSAAGDPMSWSAR